MYLACLSLPASLAEPKLELLGPALDGLNTGYYAHRIDEDDETSDWLMRWITEYAPDISDFTMRVNIWSQSQDLGIYAHEEDWTIEQIDESKNWLEESYKGFQPFEIESFYIYGSHHKDDLPKNKILLQIDAATAFGSGEHPTTAGCMEALLELKEKGVQPKNILDMGCGSGILAIAAAKLFPESSITAIDIDEEAVAVTDRHIALNDIAQKQIQTAAGDGFQCAICGENKPYDLIIANILAGPLKDMSKDLLDMLDQNGHVILSGLLNDQADDVISSYSSLTMINHRKIKEWSALLLKRD